jgi:hypothetical protein
LLRRIGTRDRLCSARAQDTRQHFGRQGTGIDPVPNHRGDAPGEFDASQECIGSGPGGSEIIPAGRRTRSPDRLAEFIEGANDLEVRRGCRADGTQ